MLSKRFYRYHFLKLVRQKGSIENLSLSTAVGIFIGLFIPFGGQILVAFIVSWYFRLNKFLSIGGLWVTNPLTIIPIYIFYLHLGSKITGVNVAKQIETFRNGEITIQTFIKFGLEGAYIFLLGALICAIISSIVVYFAVYFALQSYRANFKK